MSQSICVYLGANSGNDEKFTQSVILLGKEIASSRLTLVYGGSSLGLMGLLATTVKEHGGKVIGVITNYLAKIEQAHNVLDELHVVDSMQERKAIMQRISDVFLVMPGGLGTLEEAFETWNAIKIGILNKPIGFLNIAGFFDKLFAFIGNCKDNGFLSEKQLNFPIIDTNVQSLLRSVKRVKTKAF
jgi:uncharacterized protein (TIGR00730 family)